MNRAALDAKLYDWHFPAGPKAPAPLSVAETWRLYDTGAFIAFPQFNLPRAIAAAFKERTP